MNAFNPADLGLIVPELILGASVLALVVADLLVKEDKRKRVIITPMALGGILLTGIALILANPDISTQAFSGQIAVDPLARLFKMLFLGIALVSILTSKMSLELPDRHIGEYFVLLISITFGMFLMAGANDMLMVYLSVEFVSIVSYALAGYRLRDKRSSEAALKYVVYGGAASGIMLFGISLLYGMFGTTELTAINAELSTWATQFFADNAGATETPFPLTLLTAIVFVFAGVGYKIAVVPFHMWAPDVYEGAPTPFAGFLSVGPKAAGFAVLMRVFIGTFVEPGASGFVVDEKGLFAMSVDLPMPLVMGLVAAATMTVGNLAAIGQNNVKRLLAYSSIAHAGYMMMGFVVLSKSSMHALVMYLVIYYLMNLGAFTVVQAVRDMTGGETLHHYRGLGNKEPILAMTMVVFLASLTGLPPLAGFAAKFYLFAAVIERGGTWYWGLAIVGVLNSAVSLFYYFKIVRSMYFSSTEAEVRARISKGYAAMAGVLAVPTIVLGLYWAPLSASIREKIAIHRSTPEIQVATQVDNQ